MRVAVIGAGPAGISASLALIAKSVQVTMLDEQPSSGGQIYRNLGNMSADQAQSLGSDYITGKLLLKQLEQAIDKKILTRISRTSVWSVTEEKEVSWSIDGRSYCQKFDAIILATGSIERAMPIDGWTNPGVITVGAAQILIKTARYSPPSSVLVGSGPLFYLVACQMLEMGNPPKALLETQNNFDLLKAFIQLRPNLTSLLYLVKGLVMLAKLRFFGVKRIKAVRDVRIKSKGNAHIIEFSKAGTKSQIEAETVLLHAGVHPNIQITQALGLKHDWSQENQCFEPRTDKFGRTSLKNIFVAGDGIKILGADAAKISGKCAALALLADNGFLKAKSDLSRTYRSHQKYVQIRKFLDVLYAPKDWYSCPKNNIVICRCEEVTAGKIREAVKIGCLGPNQLKAYSRCGMGNCQGRYCGNIVVNLISEMVGQTPEETGYFRIRSPIKPVSLAEVANLKTII
jgi:NADPH-dependent 2,4-dienoyl-CoA reductase/sulfur reductase-like enzyme/bacterioferritin-associated ferredoxin